MMKVKDLEINTTLVNINVLRGVFVDTYCLKKENCITKFGNYVVVSNVKTRNSTYLTIKED